MEKVRILIVEDEGVLAKGIERKLTALGYTSAGIAFSGEEAIPMAEQTHPDLVLMDIKLAGQMDGIETAHQIREKFNIPIVYLTAFNDTRTVQRAKITEPYGYILKPVNERELHCNIEMALYKHRTEAELLRKKEMEAISKFSSGIAHDFSNLLQCIFGNVELAAKKCNIPNCKGICSFNLVKAKENLQKATDLIEQYKDIYHIYKSNLLNKTPINTQDIINKIEFALKQIQDEKNIKILYHIETDKINLSISGDVSRLEEVFIHLLRNAVEAMAENKDTGQITIFVNNVPVEHENEYLLKPGIYMKVSIQDQGKGIPMENIKKVFNPYFSTKEDECTRKGLGLGLTICYSIIKQHDGHIDIQSEKGKGTTVDIYLPTTHNEIASAS